MTKLYKKGLWWVKRDFRLRDNEALTDALKRCETVIALFVIEPELCCSEECSLLHYHAWRQASDYLSDKLNTCGGRFILRVGQVELVMDKLRREHCFDALFSHEETGSMITYQRDRRIGSWVREHAIPWYESAQNGVIRGLQDRNRRQPVIKERLIDTEPLSMASTIPAWPNAPKSDQWPSFESLSSKPVDTRIQPDALQRVTEAAAQQTLRRFLNERGVGYAGGISSPNSAFEAGSRLSTHLAWGTISLRQVYSALAQQQKLLATMTDQQSGRWRKSLSAFQARLHWRDHFMQRLESAPDMESEALNPAYRGIRYIESDPVLHAWMTGFTGLPLVDACVRCLAATGFLNFRMRAMLITTGCFGLAQSWQSLQYPLARLFLDYEPGIHFSQVQMQAGVVGINTVRVYSPHKQLLDHDPDAQFVKRWVPELREFDAQAISQYDSRKLGDYPSPIVDIKSNAKLIKDQIYAVRQSDEGRRCAALILKDHGSRRRTPDRRKPAKKKAQLKTRQLSLDFD